MVGDNRQSAEAIAPLHELYGMIKQAVADGGTGLTASEIYTAMLNALNDSKLAARSGWRATSTLMGASLRGLSHRLCGMSLFEWVAEASNSVRR